MLGSIDVTQHQVKDVEISSSQVDRSCASHPVPQLITMYHCYYFSLKGPVWYVCVSFTQWW